MEKFLFILLFFFFIACENTNDVNKQLSQKTITKKLTGIYEGNYKNARYEIWIEESEKSTQNQSFFYIFIFQKENRSSVISFLTKYIEW